MGISQPIKKEKTSPIAYAIWLPQVATNIGFNTSRLRDLTLSWLRFGYQGLVIESNSINTILEQALSSGYQACFIQTPGNIISEDWMLPHWQQADFHTCLEELQIKDDFLVCADIIKTDGYFALDTSCFLINLHHYKNMGCPSFGLATEQKRQLIKPQITYRTSNISTREITQLDPTQSSQLIQTKLQAGWGFINASLSDGLTISQLPKNLSNKRLVLSQDQQYHSLVEPFSIKTESFNLAPKSTQQHFLKGVDTQISRGRSGVFLWNIESYDDLSVSFKTVRSANEINTISNLYSVAAGFKPNMLLQHHGFEPKTCVTYFDYSQQALNIRKTLLEEWDGSDYPAFCRKIIQRFPAEETFYQLWNGLQPKQIDWVDVDRLWANELLHWGGAQGFQQQWKAQQELSYNFIHCDLVNDPTPLLEQIVDSARNTIWWSNAFFTISSNWLLSIEQRKQRFKYWIENLAGCSPKCRIYGADHNNTPVNNMNALQYLDELNKRSINTQQDELIPHHQAARAIRF